MNCNFTYAAWAGVVLTELESIAVLPMDCNTSRQRLPTDGEMVCATDPFDDFDDDDFDDEFDDDFEEEWDEELPGDADQFEPDPVEVEDKDDDLPVEPEFEDED
jgi:hypothetical protein